MTFPVEVLWRYSLAPLEGESLDSPVEQTRIHRRKRRRITPRFWLMIGLLMFAYVTTSYVLGFVEIWRLRQEVQRVEQSIAEAEVRNEELRRELAYLQSDEYIEKVAREELGLVRPGETPVIFTSPGSLSPDDSHRQQEDFRFTGP